MTAAAVTPVAEEELLARYLFLRSYVRSDGTIKPDAFIPYQFVELSVTRHLALSDEEVWKLGLDVGVARGRPLHGRADVQARTCVRVGLRVVADPLPENPNHANVVDWPTDKQSQKEKALDIAAAAQFRPFVPSED